MLTRIVRRWGVALVALAALLPVRSPVHADGSGPIDPFPITGAYSAFHRADRDHVSIIEIAGNYNKNLAGGQPNVEPRAVIAREFFRTHPDQYDFIVAFSTFDFNTGDATAFHWAVQNKVQGVGLPQFDVTSLFGSNGKLQGFIDMAALTRYRTDPLDPQFENVLSVLSHEILHQWGVRVRFRQADGTISQALLGRDNSHWSYLLDSNGSVEYGADWRDNGDGTFTSVATRKFFSPLDLYLMGFYKPNEVPPLTLIENPAIDKTQLPEENVTISGTKRTITIDDIIAAEGPRVPAADVAQKEFRIAFVLLTGPNEPVTDAQIAALNNIRTALTTRFSILTAGRAVAQVYPEAMPGETTGAPMPVEGGELRTTPASLEEGLAWLRGKQASAGYWTDKSTTRVRDTTTVVGALAQLDPLFTTAGSAVGWLNQNPSTNTDYLARHAIALSELGGDATPVRSQLATLQNADGGWGIAEGFASNPLDTALAALALAGNATYQAAVDRAAQYLLAAQNVDGGWGAAQGGASRASTTVTVLRALKALARHAGPAPAALTWLAAKQNPDGGFGDSPSTTHDTATALETFMSLDALDRIRPADAAGYLLARQNVSGSWDESTYATATAVAALKRFSFPNWAITSLVAEPASANDGDRVKLTVQLRNDANVFAPAGVLRIYDSDPATGGTPIGPDISVPLMPPRSELVFTPLWDSFDKPGAHTLYAVIDPESVQTEMSERDNRASVAVTVRSAPTAIDLALADPDILISPTQPNTLPATLAISVRVRNLGLTDANNVRVVLREGPGRDTVVGETTLNVLARSPVVANFTYVLTRPGSTTFTVQLDPDNTLAEANEVNNSAAASVGTAPSVDLAVVNADIGIDTNPAYLGNDVNFQVTLHNRGTLDTPTTQVRYLITDGSSTTELRTNDVQIAAGQSVQQTISWRVDRSGNLTFTVQLDPAGSVPEMDEGNNSASLAFTAGAPNGPNVAVSYQDFTFNPTPGLEGYDLVLTALVRNSGTTAASDVGVAFYNGDPANGGSLIGSTALANLPAGGSANATVTWVGVPTPGDKLLFVVADPANAIAEFSEDDNSAFNVLTVISLPDLAITAGDIDLAPPFPRTGETVTINARVTNLGQQPANDVVVRAFDGDPVAGGTQIGTDRVLARVEAGGSAAATFDLAIAAAGTSRPITIQVDPANAVLERNKTNNTAKKSVAVQDGDFYVSSPYFSPDTDGVKDVTEFFFRLTAAADVAVEVVNKRGKAIRRFSGAGLTNVTGGSVAWDGLDDLGRLAQDGRYVMRVVSGGASLGEAFVHLDTNRSSLLEAVDTKFGAFTNLTCELPSTSDVTLTNDDSRAFFNISYYNPPLPNEPYPKGIYRMEGDGTDIRTIVPSAFFSTTNEVPGPRYPTYTSYVSRLAPAADGSRLAFIRYDSWTSQDRFWAVDGDGRNLARLEPKPATSDAALWMSPDGKVAYTIIRENNVSILTSLHANGSGEIRRLISGVSSWGVQVSPDGRKIAAIATNGGTYNDLWIVDTQTGEAARPLNSPTSFTNYGFVWAPNSRRFAVADRKNRRILVISVNATVERVIDIPIPTVLGGLVVDQLTWASTSSELGFTAWDDGGGDGYGGYGGSAPSESDPGGIFVADLTTGNVEKVAPFRPRNGGGCGIECLASYHISTWDGADWVERGVLHYDLHYEEKALDLSAYLPDPSGQYRVRIRQIGKEAAHVESVALTIGDMRVPPTSALHLGTNQDVLAQVSQPDNEVLDLHNAEMVVNWGSMPPGPVRMLLNAREEVLSTRNAIPFSYPADAQRVYNYAVRGERPMAVDGNQSAQDNLGDPLFKVRSVPGTGHPAADVYGYVQNDGQFLYGALDFTVDNTMDREKDWASLRVRMSDGWKEFRVTVADKRYGTVGFVRTGKVYHTHKYYEFKVPLSEIGARAGDTIDLQFQAYGTAAIIVDDGKELPYAGRLLWVPGERSLLYRVYPTTTAISLDEGNAQKTVFADWGSDFNGLRFSPTGRQLLFGSGRATWDPTSSCYRQGFGDQWSFKSLYNLTADLRAIRSANGGIKLQGSAADLNFESYHLDFARAETPEDWRPIQPASGDPVVDALFTTWVPPGPGTYFVRLTVSDLAGNVRHTIKRVSWTDTPSITDVYRSPAYISPNGDGVRDEVAIHYRVLEPIHLAFDFYNAKGDRVRTLTRDHGVAGTEHNLLWDGRDDRGLPVPDGVYRMTVQNYEFLVTVDSTTPSVSIKLFDAYQPALNRRTGISYVSVAPRIEWRIDDANLNAQRFERGVGANPPEWREAQFIAGCEPSVQGNECAALNVAQFTNQRYRAIVDDLAGNERVAELPLGAEQLIVSKFGDHEPVAASAGSSLTGNVCALAPAYKRIRSALQYVPMGDETGGGALAAIGMDTVRIEMAETLRAPIAQAFVQFRASASEAWQQLPVTQLLEVALPCPFDEVDRFVEAASATDHAFAATWDIRGLTAGQTYIVRLHAIDANGADHYSNSFKFYRESLLFRGIGFPAPTGTYKFMREEAGHLLQGDNRPKPGERILWGVEFIDKPIAELRLILQSGEDPRYAKPRVFNTVYYPDKAAVFRSFDLEACRTYTGYLEAYFEPEIDPASGELVTRKQRSNSATFNIPCMRLKTKTAPVPAGACDAPSPKRVVVHIAQQAMSGTQLKLLTLSRTNPTTGEDVLFNVNQPVSVAFPPRGEPSYPYEYAIDTSQLPEGPYPLTVRLVNTDDQEISESVDVVVDHTPPAHGLTYPLEGQRVCGIPKQAKDGSPISVVPIEGTISDTGGFHYQLEYRPNVGATEFRPFHDSRSLDSREHPPKEIKPPEEDFHLHNAVVPLGELSDKTGDLVVRLRVYDRGGFERCEVRTFYFDGLVEARPMTLDRALFSPNGDGAFDTVVARYGADESVTVDVDVHVAIQDTRGVWTATGPSLRNLARQRSLLAGEDAVEWDGRDDGGIVLADGTYSVVVTLRDACGNTAKRDRFVTLDNTPPAIAVQYPRTGDPLPLMVEIQGVVTDLHMQGWSVDYGVGSFPDVWVQLRSDVRNVNSTSVLAPWNTYGLEGAYAIRVVATDTVGNQRVVNVPVNVVERTNLIAYLEGTPTLFSPNADGKRETAALRFGLDQNALVTLAILDANGTVRRTLANEQPMAKGALSLAWDGRDNGGNVLPGGTYTVGLLAALQTNPLIRQEEKITLALDTTPPAIDIARPANGFVTAAGGIIGTIADLHLTNYAVALTSTPQAPVWNDIDVGTDNRTNFTFGSLAGFAEGEYALRVQAKDEGETTSERIVPFIVDNTSPKVDVAAPLAASYLGVRKQPIEVKGTLEERYVNGYALEYGSGAAPTAWTRLITGNTLPLPDVLTNWDVSALADGPYTLRLIADDKAGLSGEKRVPVTVDNTPPIATMTAPAEDGYVRQASDILGSATDSNFLEYALDLAPGAKGTSTRWTELGRGGSAVSEGVLLNWQALPPDGVHTLRLTVKDRADNTAEHLVQVNVDTHAPAKPQGLRAAVEGGNDVRLTWAANSEPDLVGYAVYRDGVRITPALLTAPEYIDADVLEGRYTYTITAWDRAGWESERSDPAIAVVDVSPPSTQLQVPSTAATVSGLKDVKGTAYSSEDFKEYRLYVAPAADPTSLQLLRRSPVPVLADLLSQWNTVGLPEGAGYVLKLEAEDINGNVGTDTISVTVDNFPPAAPTGLIVTPSGANVQLTWNPNTEPDLYGYLVFRNDRIANAKGTVIGDLKPYALATAEYPDLALPDGPYTYYVIAMDRAGNLSDPSSAAMATVDARAPHATIAPPAANTRFDASLYILATTPDTDIARVAFQYRPAGSGAWIDLGAPDTTAPYEGALDPIALGLTHGNYQIQAIATDLSGKVDPSPTPVTVVYADVTRPAITLGLASRVNGGDVALTWTANNEADLAGYRLFRRSAQGTPVELTAAPVTGTSYVDTGVADGTYFYSVVAVDTTGNAADPSAEDDAIVYAPALKQPYTPTLASTVTITGTGIGPATVAAELNNAGGTSVLPGGATDTAGRFALTDVVLSAGDNIVTVRLLDAAGNVSKGGAVTVALGAAPSAPTGVAATANGYDVALQWNANPESNVLGYRVFRNGETVLPDMPMTDMVATASSTWGTAPAWAIDLNAYSYWSPASYDASQTAHRLTLTWPQPRIVTKAAIEWFDVNFHAVDYDVEAWTGSAWVTVAEVRNNSAAQNEVTLAAPYRTTQLRLVLLRWHNPSAYYQAVRLAEVGLFYRPLEATTGFADLAPDGNHRYTVTAVNVYAFESAPSDPASLPVGDVVAPEPVALSAAVAGSDVALAWTASASTDLARYHVYRDATLIAVHTDLVDRSYLDAARPNGTYRYTVKAVDTANNESTPSNEVDATVAIALPPAPLNLTVTAPTYGNALALTWASGTGPAPAGYRVLRSTTAGGPYTPVTDVATTALTDTGLTNGIAYFYVVAALDALGNVSSHSNESSGTPLDQEAPTVSLYYPTVPGRAYGTREAAVDVAAHSEPGAIVTLQRDGVVVGRGQARATAQTIVAPLRDNISEVTLAPNGHMALYRTARELRLYNYVDSSDVLLLTLRDYDDARPVWSPDAREAIFRETDVNNTWNRYLRAYRLSDGRIRDLTDPTDSNVESAVISPDGAELAVIAYRDGGTKLWQFSLADRSWTLLRESPYGFDTSSLSWSRDGGRLSYVRYADTGTLHEIVHTTTGAVQQVDAQAADYGPAAWSPNGEELLYTATRDGLRQVVRYSLATGIGTALTSGPNDHYAPAWSPDGGTVGYGMYSNVDGVESVQFVDLASGNMTEIVPTSYVDLPMQWTRAGYLGVRIDNEWRRIEPAGRVEFARIGLAQGDNVMSASAVDAAGNLGTPPSSIVVTQLVDARPDLSIADAELRVLPAAPLMGEATRITAVVRNLGSQTSARADLSLIAVDPAGAATTLIEGAVLNPIPAGGAQTVAVEWQAGSAAGDYRILAIVDATDRMPEVSEANNLAIRALIVADQARPRLQVTTDKAIYQSSETVVASAVVENLGETFNGRVELAIEDTDGFLVQLLAVREVRDLAYAARSTEAVGWDTGRTFAGAYRVRAQLFDAGGRLVTEAVAAFTLGSASSFAAQVSTDRGAYVANAQVTVTGAITYRLGNVVVSGAETVLRIVDAGNNVLMEQRRPAGDLLPESVHTVTLDWNTGTQAAGDYRATLALVSGTQTLVAATAAFTIEVGSEQLEGALTLAEQAPAPGTPQQVGYRVRNLGNAPLAQMPVLVSVIDASLQTVVETRRFVHDLPVGGEVAGATLFDTVGYALKNYTVLLQTELADPAGPRLVTLNTAGFTVVDRTPPTVNVKQPSESGYIRGDGTATVFAIDRLSSVKQVEISIDGGAWIVVPVYNAAESLWGDLLKALPEGAHTVQARATDAWNNTGASAPTSFIVDNTPPQIAIADILEGGIYNSDRAPVVTIVEPRLATSHMTLNGAAFQSGTPLTSDGGYTLVVSAVDRAGNRSQQQVSFVIDKTAPQIDVTGVVDGALYNVAATPVISVTDARLESYTATLNGQVYVSGTPVAADGIYELNVIARDTAGNQATAVVRFAIDRTPPTVVITNPADGSILSSRRATVEGTTEPRSAVHLTAGAYQASGFADVQGRFVFADVPLAEGENTIGVYAIDQAGNQGTAATVRVRVRTLELTAELLHGGRVLVWLPGRQDRCDDNHDDARDDGDENDSRREHKECDDGDDRDESSQGYARLAALIDATLRREGADYLIVRSRSAFVNALRMRRYTTLVLGELHPSRSSEGGVLHMDEATRLEVQGTVASGVGIVWIKNHPDSNEHWQELFGARTQGVIPNLTAVQLGASPASAEGRWNTGGPGVRLRITHGTPAGRLYPDGVRPAMVLSRYGYGNTVWLAFDPSLFVDPQGAIDTTANAIRYAQPAELPLLPGAVTELRWTANRIPAPLALRLVETLTPPTTFVLARDGTIDTPQEASWERLVEAATASFSALIRLSTEAGDYAATARLYEVQAGTPVELISRTLALSVVQRDALSADVMTALATLSVDSDDRDELNDAIDAVQDALGRQQGTLADAAYAIEKLVTAIEELDDMDADASAVIAKIGLLMAVYQAQWSALR